MLVATYDILKKYAPEFSNGLKYSDVEQTIKTVIREEVYPVFGVDYANGATGDIKNLLEEAVCNLVAFRKSYRHSIHFTGSGMQKMETPNFVSLFKNEKFDYREETRRNGYQALESALKLAIAAADFQSTDEGKEAVSRLINFTSEIKSYKLDFVTFMTLHSGIKLVEREVLKPLLQKVLYNKIKDYQYKKSELSDTEIELLDLIREGLAMYAIQLALESNTVQVAGNQVFVRLITNDDGSEQRVMPKTDMYELAIRTRREYAARYFNQVNNFIKDNAEELGWTAPITEVTTSQVSETGVKKM